MAEKEHDSLLLEMVKQLREDLAADRQERRQDAEASRESRAATHKRIDDVVERLGHIDTSIAIAGQVDAQVRAEIDALTASLKAAQPTIDEWNRVRTIGKWAIGILVTGGVGVGAVLAAVGDGLVTTIRHWLRLP